MIIDAQRRLYSFLIADFSQCLQIALNGVRHDSRLLSYLTASHRQEVDFRQLELVFTSLEGELTDLLQNSSQWASGLLVGTEDERGDPRAIVNRRHSLGLRFAALQKVAGTAREELRLLSYTDTPDLALPWARPETTEERHSRINSFASCCSSRLSAWVLPRAEAPVFPVTLRYAQRSRVSTTSERGARQFAALVVPSWFLFHHRYAPTIAHELAHPYVETYLDLEPELAAFFQERFARVQGAYVEGLEHVGDLSPSLLHEFAADFLAFELVGPSYILTLFFMGFGLTPFPVARNWRGAPELSVRLLALLSRVPSDKLLPGLNRQSSLLIVLREQIQAHVERRSTVNKTYGRFHEGLLVTAKALHAELSARLGPVHDCSEACAATPIGPGRELLSKPINLDDLKATVSAASSARRCSHCAGPGFLWALVDLVYERSDSYLPDLQALGEGALLNVLTTTRPLGRGRAQHGGALSLRDAWEMDFINARILRNGSEPPSVDEFLGSVAEALRNSTGVGGLSLGPADAVFLREGFRARCSDRFSPSSSSIRHYCKRRSLVELSLGELPQMRDSLLETTPAAVTQIRLKRPGREALRVFLSGLMSESLPHLPEPMGIFLGSGWHDLVVVWGRRSSVDSLRALHSDFLAKPDPRGLVERSVTHFLTHVTCLGASQISQPWRSTKLWAAPLRLLTLLRTQSAGDILGLSKWFSDLDLPAGVQPVYGLYDAFLSIDVHSGTELGEAVDFLWRSVSYGPVLRSMTHLQFDARQDSAEPEGITHEHR